MHPIYLVNINAFRQILFYFLFFLLFHEFFIFCHFTTIYRVCYILFSLKSFFYVENLLKFCKDLDTEKVFWKLRNFNFFLEWVIMFQIGIKSIYQVFKTTINIVGLIMFQTLNELLFLGSEVIFLLFVMDDSNKC